MKCPNCAVEIREGVRFCHRCGAAVRPSTLSPLEMEGGEAVAQPTPLPVPAAMGVEATIEGQQGGVETKLEEDAPEEAEGPEVEPTVNPFSFFRDEEVEPEGAPLKELLELEGAEIELITSAPEETEGPSPVALGTVLGGRYAVAEILDAREEEVLYRVYDMRKCWACGSEENALDEAYCSDCGAALDRKPACRLQERLLAGGEELTVSGEGGGARFVENGRLYLVLEEPAAAPPQAAPSLAGLRLIVGQRSDPGMQRELDEDSLLALSLSCTHESQIGPTLGLYAVADGIGGHESGEVASKLAARILAEHLIKNVFLPELGGEPCLEETIIVRMREAVQAVNDAVFLARQKGNSDMGTTLTAALVKGDRAYLAHVGDCRAYLWNREGLRQLTTDHSLVASLIATGMAEPGQIYTHPQRNLIYRCIGDKPVVEVDTDIQPLAPGDRLILCCDGLWEMVRDEGIEEVMLREADPQAACDELVHQANLAGGEDNISVIIVGVEHH